MKLHQVIDSHMERYDNFEAAMDMLCLVVVEIKNILYNEEMSNDNKRKKIIQIKEVLLKLQSSRFNEEELKILNGFIAQNIDLCDKTINALK